MILCPDNRFSSTWTTLQCQVNISALYIDHLNEVNYQYGIETVLCKVLVCLADEMVSYLSVIGVAVRWRIVGDMTGWLGSSVVECSHCQRKALGSNPGRATIFHLLHVSHQLRLILAQGIQAGHVVIRSDKCHFLQMLLPPKGYHGYQLK